MWYLWWIVWESSALNYCACTLATARCWHTLFRSSSLDSFFFFSFSWAVFPWDARASHHRSVGLFLDICTVPPGRGSGRKWLLISLCHMGAIVLGFSLWPGFRPDMLPPSTITTTSDCPCHATCAGVRWFFLIPPPPPPASFEPTRDSRGAVALTESETVRQ
jgi:hypothetical protein